MSTIGRMKGGVVERSPGRFAIVLDIHDAAGKRRSKSTSCKGTMRQAQVEPARLTAAMGQGDYVEPSKSTIAEFVRARVGAWEAAGTITPRTSQRYRQLIEHQIAPHLGTRLLQKLTRL